MTDQDNPGHIFIPGKEETLLGRIRLRYSPIADCYFSGTCEDFTNRPKRVGNSFTELAYNHENVVRTMNENTKEVYLERKSKELNGRMVWRFNFAPCGLVLDRLTMKMAYQECNDGQVIVSVAGNTIAGVKTAHYCSSDVYMTITRLEGSSSLTITVNLNGESENDSTRIFTESKENSHHLIDYPFDFQIRLKRPDFTIGRSLVFIGLMYSHKELPTSNGIKQQRKRSKSKKDVTDSGGSSSGSGGGGGGNGGGDSGGASKGFLNVLIYKGKRLPCRENGAYAEPKVKCTLYSGKGHSQKVKTRAIGKTLNPTWNERLAISNVELNQLAYSQLELQVVHSKSMFKLKSSETLGYIVLQRQNVVGTWKKPVCRNHSVRIADVQSSIKATATGGKKIDTVSHYTTTARDDDKKTEKVVDYPFNISLQNRSIEEEEEDYAKTENPNGNGLCVNDKSRVVQQQWAVDIFNLPDLKESSVDDVTVDVVDDLGSFKADNNNNNSSLHSSHNNNDTLDSDMFNITFSDDNIKQLIQRSPQSCQATTKREQNATYDESFEILPHSVEEEKEASFKPENSANHLQNSSNLNNVVIENKIYESQTDGILENRQQEFNGHSRAKLRRSISDTKIDLSSYFTKSNFNKDEQNTSQEDSSEKLGPGNNKSSATSCSPDDILKPLPTFQGHNTTTESINNVADLSSIEETELQSKRRAVSVDNSQLTPSQTRRYTVNNSKNNNEHTSNTNKVTHEHTSRNNGAAKKPNLQRAHSMSDLLDVNRRREKKFNKRKGFSSKLYRSGSISNILDDFFEEKAKAMSHEHWSTVVGNPERWFYCWHPLLGVNNLLSNWQ